MKIHSSCKGTLLWELAKYFQCFFGWKSEKDFSPWGLKFFIKLIFRRNKLHTSRIMSIFVCEELKMTDYA